MINKTFTIAVIEAEPPTLTNFLKLNSKPKLNRRKITPISPQMLMLLVSVTDGKKNLGENQQEVRLKYNPALEVV